MENEAERDLEAEVEAFMRKQAEAEGSISDAQKPERVLGADIVSDSDAEAMCKGILSVSLCRSCPVACDAVRRRPGTGQHS